MLCGVPLTCAHCVTGRVRLLVLVLSKLYAIIVFGIQLVRYNVIQSGLEYEFINTECSFLHVYMFYHFASMPFHCMA